MNKVLFSVIIFVCFNHSYSQKQTTHQKLVWYGLFSTLEFNDKWNLQTEIQERQFINPTAQHQILLRTHLHRLLGKSGWETSAGFCVFFQNPNNPLASVKLTRPELRPHIEMMNKQKISKLTINHRYRLEARFFHNTNDDVTDLENGFGFGYLRCRYKIQGLLPLCNFSNNRKLRMKVSDEILLNVGNNIVTNVFDQNRIYSGLNLEVSETISMELGLLNWFQQRPNGDFYNRNILRCTVFHKMSLNKNKPKS